MSKSIFVYVFALLFSSSAFSQNGNINGVVRDGITGESLPGVAVLYAEGKGANTDVDGNFSFTLPYGDYELTFNLVSYEKSVKKISLSKANVSLVIELIPMELDEVVIAADYIIGRDVPVAYSNIPMKRVEEELASRDVAQIVNTVPGSYATQQGGGDGDARVTIRGFSQNNVAVMLDGVPVNDMEN